MKRRTCLLFLAGTLLPAAHAAGPAAARLLSPESVWAGEVFVVRFELSVDKAVFDSVSSPVLGQPSSVRADPWVAVPAAATSVSAATTRVLAVGPGTFELPRIRQEVTLVTGVSRFGAYTRPNLESVPVEAPPRTVTARPLPPAPRTGAPFRGAVGNFHLHSRVSPSTVVAGEPVTWTLEMSGNGNWPGLSPLPARVAPGTAKIVNTVSRFAPKEGTQFEGTLTEDVTLVPAKPGSLTVGPVSVSVFDPAKGVYVSVEAPAASVTVMAAESEGSSWILGGGGADARQKAPAPALPEPTLRDPLPPSLPVAAPLSLRLWLLESVASAGIVGLLWFALAVDRFRTNDPNAARRSARHRVLRIILDLSRGGDPDQVRAKVHAWQQEAAVLTGVKGSTPTALSFPPGPWRDLWAQANTVVFSKSAALPVDWCARAARAAETLSIPRPRPTLGAVRAALLPSALVLLGAVVPLARADDAHLPYKEGRFKEAEAIWRRDLAEHPRNAAVHHNLALSLAQQDRWAEAAAHTVAAFVQDPTNSVIRWDLAVMWEASHFGTPEVAALMEPTPRAWVASRATPSRWQSVWFAALTLTLLGASALLLVRFGRLRPSYRRLGKASVSAGLVALGFAASSLLVYGSLGSAQTCLVWRDTPLRSVPTEAGSRQRVATLSAGSLAQVDDSFLGWRHVTLGNGQTGWIRKGDFVDLWQ